MKYHQPDPLSSLSSRLHLLCFTSAADQVSNVKILSVISGFNNTAGKDGFGNGNHKTALVRHHHVLIRQQVRAVPLFIM